MLDDPERPRYTIPALMALFIALYAGSRIEQAREPEAIALALGFPVACAWLARSPFAEASGPTRVAAEAAAALTLVLVVSRNALTLFGGPGATEWVRAAWLDVLSIGIGLTALGVEYGARRHAIPSRYAAWLGCALVSAVHLARSGGNGDRFQTIFGALFVGFLAGGGTGLLLGAWVRHMARPARS